MIYLAVILAALGIVPSLLVGQGEQLANFAYDLCNMLMLPTILYALFLVLDKTKVLERGVVVALFVGFSFKVVNYLSYMLSIDLAPVVYVLSTGLALYFLKQAVICEDIPDTKIEEHKTYFVFKKPKSLLDFLVTFFKYPVGSFSIVNNYKWYKYSKSYEGLYTSDISAMDLNIYKLVPVKDVDEDILKALVGTKWSLVKSNCITVFKPVFLSLGIKLNKLDFIPSIFAYKFFKNHEIR